MAFEKLFEPGEIGTMKLKNRIVMAPMTIHVSGISGSSHARAEFYVRRAQGGAGLIIGGAASVDGRYASVGMSELYSDAGVSGYFDMANAIHVYGVKLWVQLAHPGRQWTPVPGRDALPIAPSPIPSRAFHLGTRPVPHEMTIPEVEDLVAKFAQAARRAQKAGIDGVELHAAHGYLINQFFSSATNKRADKYGGNADQRATFAVEIIQGIRQLCGKDYPVSVRLNGHDYVDGGNDNEDYQAISRAVEKAGAACIHVSGGMSESTRDRLYGGATAPIGVPFGWFVSLAEGIKKAVKIPVIACGGLGHDPELAESVLREGKADFAGMCRPLIADPDLPVKVKTGRIDEINWCIRCGQCHPEDRDMLRKPIARCSVNAFAFKETAWQINPAPKAKKVMVIGGGPGGMEAARVARLRGHEVTLYERDARLGGQVWMAAVPPTKGELARAAEHLEGEMKRTGVKVETGVEVTPALVRRAKPDAVVVATGVEENIPDIPGIRGKNVVSVSDLLLKKVPTGKRIVVLGGNVEGAEVADYLQQQGKKVTVLVRRTQEMLSENDGRGVISEQEKERFPDFWGIARDVARRYRVTLMLRLEKGGLKALFGCQIKEITGKGVRITQKGEGGRVIEADTVVLAWGGRPSTGLYDKLVGRVPELYMVGDCVSPRTIGDAVDDGAYVGLRI